MNVTVNGEPRTLAPRTCLGALLELEQAPRRGTAAAVDGEVVPRSAWAHFVLHDGQAVELLTAVQGG
jgi:sulfur carrier protein